MLRGVPSRRSARRAFTLIELLAVILILGILAGLLITQLGGAQEGALVGATRARLKLVESAIDAYEHEKGDFPKSSFSAQQAVPNDGLNVGVEALVVSLWSGGYEGGGLLDDVRDALVNGDGDSSSQQLTDFGNKELFEIVDGWNNPIAYLHRQDYGGSQRFYRTFDPLDGEELETAPAAFKNERLGSYYKPNSFQLISAGPDARFGTEDDITDFERD